MPGNSEMPSHMQYLAISFIKIKSPFLPLRSRETENEKQIRLTLGGHFHLSAVLFQPSCKPVPPILQSCFSHFTAQSHPFHHAKWVRLHGKMGEIGMQGVSSWLSIWIWWHFNRKEHASEATHQPKQKSVFRGAICAIRNAGAPSNEWWYTRVCFFYACFGPLFSVKWRGMWP